MAAVEVTITGVLYDKYARTSRPVVLIGDATLIGVGVGGGPIEGGPGSPPGIWGPTDPRRTHPIVQPPDSGSPPGIWGPTDPRPTHPIVLPPDQVPPGMQPPSPPPPGTTSPVPPPEGSGGWPVSGQVPPPYVVMTYPGVGPIYVAPPLTATPKK
jgi:hypothetical protein